jgi:hypothetical protein
MNQIIEYKEQFMKVSDWALEMEESFEECKHFPTLEMMGMGNYVFFFYDLPNNQRLGINDECIVLYSSDPDCEGVWNHYYADNMNTIQKVILAIDIFNLVNGKAN